MKPSGASIPGLEIEVEFKSSGGEIPKFHSPLTPSKALSVEANPSMEYWPVSC